VLNSSEDCHVKRMSTFEADEHLRGAGAGPFPGVLPPLMKFLNGFSVEHGAENSGL
jgi:hypothetical protein